MRKSHALLVVTLSLGTLPAFADSVSISVTPWLAPNVYGSPSYNTAATNAVAAEAQGVSSYGSAGPTQFNAQPNINSAQGVVTNFSSWMGVANPGGAYANELGNRMSFAAAIVGGPGTDFSISQLSFNASSTDPYDALAFSHAAGFYNYSTFYEGVIDNPDGTFTYVTSGPNTQLVNAIYAAGSGVSFQATCTGCTTQQEQQAIYDQAAYYPGTPFQFTGTYSIDGGSGSGTFNISPAADPSSVTPEPSSLVLLGTGALGIAGALRRRYLAR